MESRQWGYSLITGPCIPYAPLLVGFNWGARVGEEYSSRETIEETSLKNEDLGSLIRVVPYWEKYLPEHVLAHASQTNYCFFRSKNESQISERDLALCRPIFNRLLEIVKPSIVLCFSSKLRDYMVSTDKIKRLEKKPLEYKRGQSQVTYLVMKGELATGVTIAFLPHPMYRMTTAARDAAWAFCFDKG